MPDHPYRFVSLAVALLGMQLTGGGQEPVRRAERAVPGNNYPTAPAAPAYPNAGQAQPAGNYQPAPGLGMMERAALIDPNKKLAVGDQVSVEIVEDREGAIPRVITATGDLEVPPLDRVHVAGKTTSEAASLIKRKLDADYYFSATVKLSIDRVNASATMGRIIVSGEVRSPQELPTFAGENLTVSAAILRTGGFSPWAKKDKVEIIRKGSQEKIVVNVGDILGKGKVENDILLQDGDRVIVPKAFIRLN